jgi:hypothetical protein
MPAIEIQLLPIIVAAIADMVIGALWYSKLLFGKQWMKLANFSEKDTESTPVSQYLISTAAAFFLSFVLFQFINFAGVTTNLEALQFSLWVWFGFGIAISISKQVFDAGNWGLYFIFYSYKLLSIIAMSLIFINL